MKMKQNQERYTQRVSLKLNSKWWISKQKKKSIKKVFLLYRIHCIVTNVHQKTKKTYIIDHINYYIRKWGLKKEC